MPESAQTAKPLLTAAELSAATELTLPQVYSWAAQGRFPAEFLFRVGRKVFFKRGLLDWLAGRNGAEPPASRQG